MAAVLRFVRPMTRATLERVLTGEEVPTERLHSNLPLEPLRDAIQGLDPAVSGSQIDGALVEPVHRALAGISRSEAGDMRVWHWLNAVAFPWLSWRRWRGFDSPPEGELGAELNDAMVGRFLGTNSVGGTSRNTIARLYWAAESVEGDYEAARFLLSRQDMFVQIQERLFGLYPPAVRACLARFPSRSEEEIRHASRWLNYAATTTILEVLTEDQIGAILDEALGAVAVVAPGDGRPNGAPAG